MLLINVHTNDQMPVIVSQCLIYKRDAVRSHNAQIKTRLIYVRRLVVNFCLCLDVFVCVIRDDSMICMDVWKILQICKMMTEMVFQI
jgi:hypothetical protein